MSYVGIHEIYFSRGQTRMMKPMKTVCRYSIIFVPCKTSKTNGIDTQVIGLYNTPYSTSILQPPLAEIAIAMHPRRQEGSGFRFDPHDRMHHPYNYGKQESLRTHPLDAHSQIVGLFLYNHVLPSLCN
jgi:hypothetical protein